MSFALSFSPEFFYPEDVDAVEPVEQPTSVYQALVSLSDETRQQIAENIAGSTHSQVDIEQMMDRIRETNTCSNLTSPVEVWVDQEGELRINIFEATSQAA